MDEVCQVIVENMWLESVEKHFPKSKEEFLVKMQEMESEWQFEYAFSAIDNSHLPIKCPPGGAEAMKHYQNFKTHNFKTLILLALADAKYRFIWASLGAPGNNTTQICSSQLHYGQTWSVEIFYLKQQLKLMMILLFRH